MMLKSWKIENELALVLWSSKWNYRGDVPEARPLLKEVMEYKLKVKDVLLDAPMELS